MKNLLVGQEFQFDGAEWIVRKVVNTEDCPMPEEEITSKNEEISPEQYEIPWWGLKPGEEPPEDIYLISGGRISRDVWTPGLILYFRSPELISYMLFAELL